MSSIELFNLPPTLRTLSVSRKGSNLKMLLDLCIIVFDFNDKFHDWMNVVAASQISSPEPSPTAPCL